MNIKLNIGKYFIIIFCNSYTVFVFDQDSPVGIDYGNIMLHYAVYKSFYGNEMIISAHAIWGIPCSSIGFVAPLSQRCSEYL